MVNDNKIKNIILSVLVVGLVGMTVAFAALTQQLNITDNVATVSSNWRVRFAPTVTTSVGTTISGTTSGATYTTGTPTVTNDEQTISGLQATLKKPGDYVEVAFTVRNEGNIAAKGQSVTLSLGNLSCAPSSGSSISQSGANSFCSKITKWVKHSDRVTDWTQNDKLAAYTGSGDYPSIDGIIRLELPSTLGNDDIAILNNGGVVVTLGDTTLNFEQDDNPSPVVPEVSYTYYTSIQTGGGPTLPEGSKYWIQENNSTHVKEVCGVFPNGTVCLINDSNGRESQFGIFDQETGYQVTGYALEKRTEMLNKGAYGCPITSDTFTCYGAGINCYVNSAGNVNCKSSSDESRKCSIVSDGSGYCQ